MVHLSRSVWLLALLFSFSFLSSAQEQGPEEAFLVSILEFKKGASGDSYEVEVKVAKVVSGRLKIPTRSDQVDPNNARRIQFQITDGGQTVLDELALIDPLTIDYEYVGEDGALGHTSVAKDTWSILIRRPITANASAIRVLQTSNQRSVETLNYKFR